jgi:hypothetical protein
MSNGNVRLLDGVALSVQLLLDVQARRKRVSSAVWFPSISGGGYSKAGLEWDFFASSSTVLSQRSVSVKSAPNSTKSKATFYISFCSYNVGHPVRCRSPGSIHGSSLAHQPSRRSDNTQIKNAWQSRAADTNLYGGCI